VSIGQVFLYYFFQKKELGFWAELNKVTLMQESMQLQEQHPQLALLWYGFSPSFFKFFV
jgi:hypothetical protein